jgi:glucosamine--fructose-6-phosphate aminotransferase (isomerizing)
MREEALSAADAVARQLKSDEDRYGELDAWLARHPAQSIVTIARGSSDHAAGYFAYLSALHGGRLVTSLSLSLLTLYGAPLSAPGLLALAISQSGGSPDVRLPIERLRAGGATTVALVNDEASPLAEAAQWTLPLHAGPERSVAATKSFITSLTAGARLVAQWAKDPELRAGLHDLPQALHEACRQDWGAAIPALQGADRVLVIGRGPGLAIAQEAALKFKETCAIQAEAFSSAEVRHGPMALVEAGYPLLVFAPRGPAQADLLALSDEMRGRGARVLLAAPADVPARELTLATSALPSLDPVAAIQSFYLMVDALSQARGLDPDRPRHLRKVTATL